MNNPLDGDLARRELAHQRRHALVDLAQPRGNSAPLVRIAPLATLARLASTQSMMPKPVACEPDRCRGCAPRRRESSSGAA